MAKKKSFEEKAKEMFKDVKDSTEKFEKKDIENNKGMAVLSYIIAPIPYFVEKKSKWVKYHSTQGMNLLLLAIITNIALSLIFTILLWPLWFISSIFWAIFNAAYAILCIIGIVNVLNGKAKEIPIVNKFKIIK